MPLYGTTFGIPTVFVRRTAGDITLNQAATTTWADVTSAMDLVVPSPVVVGDVIELGMHGANNNTSGVYAVFDYRTAAGSNYVIGTGGATDNGFAWTFRNLASGTEYGTVTGVCHYTVVAGDISAGSVTFRLRYRVRVAAANEVLVGVNNGLGPALRLWAKNLRQ